MGTLGVPYQVEYDALNYRSGIEGIYAYVLRPDGTIVGPFEMTEGTSFFYGSYFFNYISQTSDPEGEYMVRIFSPQEGERISTLRMSLYPAPATEADLQNAVTTLTNEIDELECKVQFIAANVV